MQSKKKENNNYPSWVCKDCGLLANKLTCLEKYGSEPKKKMYDIYTAKLKGVCEICKKEDVVIPSRDFFYPDFNLITKQS